MKRNTHVIVPAARFRLLAGEDCMTCYQVGWRTARCAACASPRVWQIAKYAAAAQRSCLPLQ